MLFSNVTQGFTRSPFFLKKIANSLAVPLMRCILAQFWLRSLIDSFLMRFPLLRNMLIQVAAGSGLIEYPQQILESDYLRKHGIYSDFNKMSDSAKRIYFDLNKAIEKQRIEK